VTPLTAATALATGHLDAARLAYAVLAAEHPLEPAFRALTEVLAATPGPAPRASAPRRPAAPTPTGAAARRLVVAVTGGSPGARVLVDSSPRVTLDGDGVAHLLVEGAPGAVLRLVVETGAAAGARGDASSPPSAVRSLRVGDRDDVVLVAVPPPLGPPPPRASSRPAAPSRPRPVSRPYPLR
jgi:hypothetical protein